MSSVTCSTCSRPFPAETMSVIHPDACVWCAQKRMAAEKAAPVVTAPVRPRPVWATLPERGDFADEHDQNLHLINDGDSYICELATGEQVWAVYSRDGGFELCDDEGTALDDWRNPLDNVRRVMVRGHVAGFGPSCPKAGEPQKIGLVVVQPRRERLLEVA